MCNIVIVPLNLILMPKANWTHNGDFRDQGACFNLHTKDTTEMELAILILKKGKHLEC